MREHYDFSKMEGRQNPYTKYLKQPITIRLDQETIDYFKSLAVEMALPYQTIIETFRETPPIGDCLFGELSGWEG